MPLTTQREAFAQALSGGMSKADAYRAAFKVKQGTQLKSIHQTASKIAADPKVISRVAELQKQTLKRNEVTVDTLIAELEDARKVAMIGERPQAAAAIAATMGKAKLLGLGIDRHELTGKDGAPLLPPPASLAAMFVAYETPNVQ